MKDHQLTREEYTQKLKDNLVKVNQYYDPDFIRNLAQNVLYILETVYFRPVFIGFDEPIKRNNPSHPVILVSNHSGMAFPWDAIIFGAGFFKRMGYKDEKMVRAMVAPMLSQTNLMNPYLVPDLWYKIGGVNATFFNFETMMFNKHQNILIFPEGVPGIGKGWNRRYQLQRFATSFVRISLKYRTDIMPYYCVNGEYINPHTYSFNWVNKLIKKIGIPFLPIGILLILLPLQPWIFYYAWPAKLTYVRGNRVKPYEWIDKSFDDITEQEISEIRDRIQAGMQKELDLAVEKYGHNPFEWKEHFSRIWNNRKLFPYFLPWGWMFVFLEFIRLWEKRKPGEDVKVSLGFGSFFRILIRNPFIIFYFIPVIGLIVILIAGHFGHKKK